MIFNSRLEVLKAKDYATLLCAISGIISIALSIQKEFFLAACFIFLAAAFDFLDGKIARLLNAGKDASNEFGKQIDSLADAVSFASAPAALLIASSQKGGFELLVLVAACFYCASGIVRLALFNLQGPKEKGVYKGLPIPIAAMLVSSAVIFAPQDYWAVAIVAIAAGFAMLLGFSYSKKGLKKKTGLPFVFD